MELANSETAHSVFNSFRKKQNRWKKHLLLNEEVYIFNESTMCISLEVAKVPWLLKCIYIEHCISKSYQENYYVYNISASQYCKVIIICWLLICGV